MSDKFVSHGNTYNGDGTSAVAASSDGGVGAWNSLTEVFFDGVSYGSINAGDCVYMRTSISGVNVDILYSRDCASISYGSANNPVFFIADDGTKWAGENGQIAMAVNSNNYEMFTGDRGYQWWLCGDKDNCRFKVEDRVPSGHNQLWGNFISSNGSIFEGVETNATYVGSTTAISQMTLGGPITFNNCNFRHFKRRYQNGGYGNFTLSTGMIRVNGSYFDATGGLSVDNGGMSWGSYGSGIMIRGCKLVGFPAGDSLFDQMVASDTGYQEKLLIMSFVDMGLARKDYMQDALGHLGCMVEMSNINNARDSYLESFLGYTEWAKGKNYPYMASVLPTNEVWTLKAINGKEISEVTPFVIGGIKKLWNRTATKLKVTLNFIIKDTSASSHAFDNIKAKDMYVGMYYIDNTTGRTKTQFSAIDDSALASSIAGWLPVVGGNVAYGENSYNAFKIEITTDTTVKEDSLIGVVILTGIPKTEVTDYNFIDPDIGLEAVT